MTRTLTKRTNLNLFTAALLCWGAISVPAKDTSNLGASTVQSLLKNNPTLSAEDATIQALREVKKKKVARCGAAEEGLGVVWQRTPGNLKSASLRIMQADPQVAGYVVRAAGRLNPDVNQEVMVAAVKANPEFVGFTVQAACDNAPARYRELALAADVALPGHSLDIISGVMASGCPVGRAICWHFAALQKRKNLDVAAVLDEAVQWEVDAQKGSLPKIQETALLSAKP